MAGKSDRVPTEAEAVEYIAALVRLEQTPGHAQATVRMGPFTSFAVISALQLAARHPAMKEAMTARLDDVIGQLMALFAGTPGEMILGTGMEPAFDIPQGCRYPGGPHAPECGPGDHPAFR